MSRSLLITATAFVTLAAGTAWAMIFLRRSPAPPPPSIESQVQQDMAKECRVNGSEIVKSLADATERGLISAIDYQADHIAVIAVDEQSWESAGDVVQTTIEIAGFCKVSTPDGLGTVIIRGAPGGHELERLVNGRVISGAAIP